MKTIRFGIIGCGLMGREFASAVARWCHLTDMPVRPEIIAICNRSSTPFAWFKSHFPAIQQVTHDAGELLSNPDVDAVYIALPHHLHAETYIAAIKAGKHLMGEKPFGINIQANRAINEAIVKNPDVFVRCVSQFPFYPAVQEIGRMVEQGEFGRVIEISTGFLHSSDLNVDKPINWKRMIDHNGVYGVLGDLGMHACHVPLRAGWRPRSVSAVLSNLVTERWSDQTMTEKVPCETWDNATLLIETEAHAGGPVFPWMLRTFRIAPGERNSWYVNIRGTEASVRFNTRNSGILYRLITENGRQNWEEIQLGYQTSYPTITNGIFEFGFTDAVLQMWAAFLYELTTGATPSRFAGCVTPDEVAVTHQLFSAALAGAESGQVQRLSC